MKPDFPQFSVVAAGAALGAIKDVAVTGGAAMAAGALTDPALTEMDRETLGAAWHWLYGQNDPLNVDFLPTVTPDALAKAITDPDQRTWVAHSLAVLPFVDGKLDDAKMARAAAYCDAMGIHADYVQQMQQGAETRLTAVLACMIRENIVSINNGPWPGTDALAYFLPYRDNPDPALEARHEALANLPPDTLGNHYYAWYKRNNFAFPGDPHGLSPHFAWPHDTAHLLSGYNTTPHGELLVSTFTAGMHPLHPMEGHILPVIFSWHLGIKLNAIAKSYTGAFAPDLFWEAWERGAKVTTDVFAPDWDFWAACEKPLEQLRQEYGVPASAYPFERTAA